MSAGYENRPERDHPSPEAKHWRAERVLPFFGTGIAIRITADDKSKGVVYAESDEEAEWIIQRMTHNP